MSCNCGNKTVSSQPALVELPRPAQQGHRPPPCVRHKGNLYGLPDYGDKTLLHDRCVHDLVDELLQLWASVVAHNGQTTWKTLHDLHTRDIDHLVQELQLENLHGRKDHEDEPLRHEGNVDNCPKTTVFTAV